MQQPRLPRHLLSVWNPSYADDAMDRHLEVLLRWAAARREGRSDDDDVYVWWAKLRSPNRQAPLPHAGEVLDLASQIDAGIETHLYLTDYSSLYVAHLVEVTADSVPEDFPDERGHMPTYYDQHDADFWFRIWDIRRLVAGDPPATIEELKRLRNVRYHDRPVSLYGGIVDLPLIVTRDDGASWFADSGALTEGRRWAERDAELKGETERLSAELRDNLLGKGRAGIVVQDVPDHGGSRIPGQARRPRVRFFRFGRRGDKGGGDGTQRARLPGAAQNPGQGPSCSA
jgi:hypothetical protein